jgi:hypothetical protein
MFLAAIDRGDLNRIRELVDAGAEPTIGDAARILGLIRRQRPEQFERAAVRWMERFSGEHARSIDDLERAVDVLDLLREDAGAAVTLARLVTS